jgi:hypothetical protein
MFHSALTVLLVVGWLPSVLAEAVPEERQSGDTRRSNPTRAIAVVAEIDREYVRKISLIPSDLTGKSRYAEEGRILHHLLRDRCVRHGYEPIASAFVEVGQSSRHTPNFRRLEGSLIAILADDGKRELLIEMLSHRCPEWLDSGNSLEFTLVAVGDKRLADGILVLCDAFDSARSDANRKTILKILRRAFVGVAIVAPNDRGFVEGCRIWYRANKDRIYLNDLYRADPLDKTSRLFIVGGSKTEETESRVEGQSPGGRLGIRDSKATAIPSPPLSLPAPGSIRPDASARITTVRRTVNPATGRPALSGCCRVHGHLKMPLDCCANQFDLRRPARRRWLCPVSREWNQDVGGQRNGLAEEWDARQWNLRRGDRGLVSGFRRVSSSHLSPLSGNSLARHSLALFTPGAASFTPPWCPDRFLPGRSMPIGRRITIPAPAVKSDGTWTALDAE